MSSAHRHWTRVGVPVPPDAADAVSALLMRICPNGVVVDESPDEVTLTGYLAPGTRPADAVAAVRVALDSVPEELLPRPVRVGVETVPERDWVAAFRAHCHPLREGRIVVKPTWESWPSPKLDARPDDLIIELDPGMAFGTGTHPTTQGCLSALQSVVRPGARLIDFGCGSGILSIAAVLLGAAEVLALDCDPLAVEVASANAAANAVAPRLQVAERDTLSGLRAGWDIIVANISAPLTAAIAGDARSLLRAGGSYIAAGIPLERGGEVADALAAAGFEDIAREVRDEWVLVTGVVPGGERA